MIHAIRYSCNGKIPGVQKIYEVLYFDTKRRGRTPNNLFSNFQDQKNKMHASHDSSYGMKVLLNRRRSYLFFGQKTPQKARPLSRHRIVRKTKQKSTRHTRTPTHIETRPPACVTPPTPLARTTCCHDHAQDRVINMYSFFMSQR